MVEEAWTIDNAVPDGVDDSLRSNMDAAGELLPERALLHEVIIQVVTERDLDNLYPDLEDYDDKLLQLMDDIRDSPEFQRLAESGNFTREDVTRLLDGNNLDRLPVVPQAEHVTVMVTGGPATGKTALVNQVEAARPDILEHAVRINPDDFRAIFADPDIFGQAYADMAQMECNHITKAMLARLQENIAAGNAPHVLLDVVSPNERRMAMAMESGELIVIAGTKPADVAVEDSFNRGQPRIDPETGLEVPGRQTPTFVVLEGAAKAAGSNPDIFEHPNVSFHLFDTNTGRAPDGSYNPPRLIGEWDADTRTIQIADPDAFIDYLERQGINQNAASVDEMLEAANRTPERMAEYLQPYLDQGISLEFIGPDGNVAMSVTPDAVHVHAPLDSSRGANYFAEFANEATELISPNIVPFRAAGLADEGLEAVQEISRLARAARLATNTPLVGPAVGVGAAVLTNLAHSGQREFAENLFNEGGLSPEAYQAYIELNTQLEFLLHGDNGISTLDPTGASIVLTAAVEYQAGRAFQAWADQYAPHLSEEQYQSMAMSLFSGNSAQHELFEDSISSLPNNKDGQPEVLHDLIDARNAYYQSWNDMVNTNGLYAGQVPSAEMQASMDASREAYEQSQADLMAEMGRLLYDPETANAFLSVLPVDERLEFVRSLVESEPEVIQARAAYNEALEDFNNNMANGEFAHEDSISLARELQEAQEALEVAYFEALEESNPQIAEYIREYRDSFTGWFLEHDDAIYANPELLNDYIIARTNPGEPEASPGIMADADLGTFSGDDATFAGDPEMAAAAMAAGIVLHQGMVQRDAPAAAAVETRPDSPGL